MRARIFEGKKPSTVEHALEIARKTDLVADLAPHTPGEGHGLVGNCKKCLDLGFASNRAWMLVEDKHYILVLSVGSFHSMADCKMSGHFTEGQEVNIDYLNISLV